MKVLLLNTYPSGGGAAVAAQRMLQGLLEEGVDARLLVANTFHNETKEISGLNPIVHKALFVAERIQILFVNGGSRSRLFRFSSASTGIDISQHPWVKWADIIHLHWVQQGFLSLSGLEKLFNLPDKKFFWSLHDLWPITGGCHIPYYMDSGETLFCHKNEQDCSSCPLLSAHSKLAHNILERKKNFPHHKIQYLGVSQAVTLEIKKYLGNHTNTLPPKTISNIINQQKFYPSSESPDEITLLFVAARVDDPIKGLDLLQQVLSEACALSSDFEKNAEIIIIGKAKKEFKMPIKTIRYERVTESELLKAYQSATITLSTSRYETFGQTLLESIACGTPAMAFNVGGTSDIIQEGVNGALITPYHTSEYAKKLIKFIGIKHEKEAIVKTSEPFFAKKVIHQLKNLYESSINSYPF